MIFVGHFQEKNSLTSGNKIFEKNLPKLICLYSPFWGYWDHCLYKDSSRPDWVALDWKTKHDEIWSEIKADATFGEYDPPKLFLESVITSFENEWDILPAGRVKAIHAIGAVCPFSVDVTENSPFTGLLKVRKNHQKSDS